MQLCAAQRDVLDGGEQVGPLRRHRDDRQRRGARTLGRDSPRRDDRGAQAGGGEGGDELARVVAFSSQILAHGHQKADARGVPAGEHDYGGGEGIAQSIGFLAHRFAVAAEFGRAYSKDEMEVMAVDSKIKGSVKFIEIPGGDTAMLPAGGGASVYYSDAVVARGGKLANYAEYSGDPPDWAVEVLTEKVCSLPGIKNIIVGGAIANFTDVKKTFGGIINGFRKAKADGKLKGVKIWVRRGGPREKEGLDAMRALKDEGFDINVFDRYTPLTDIVDKALQGK